MGIPKTVEWWQSLTVRIEPWWTLVGAPIIQESVFRYLPYQLYFSYGGYNEIGIASSLLFAAIHWYFGKWFVLYAFVWGLVLWIVMVNYGLVATMVLHVLLNFVHWRLGILPHKR